MTIKKNNQPKFNISIVIITSNRRDRLNIILNSIAVQKEYKNLEIVIIDSSIEKNNTIEIPSSINCKVIPSDIKPLGQLRELGFNHSSGDYIVFLEEHCKLSNDWYIKLSQYIDLNNPDAIAFQIITGNSRYLFARINDFVHFLPFKFPFPGKPYFGMPSNNPVLKKSILETQNEQLRVLLEHEVLFHKELKQKKVIIHFNPEIKVYHYSETNLNDILKASLLYTISLENKRRNGRILTGIQIFKLLFAIGIPIFRSLKMFLFILKYKPKVLPKFFIYLPVIFIIHGAASIGLFIGNIIYKNNVSQQFAYHVLNCERKI